MAKVFIPNKYSDKIETKAWPVLIDKVRAHLSVLGTSLQDNLSQIMNKRVDSQGSEVVNPSIGTGSAGVAYALFKYA